MTSWPNTNPRYVAYCVAHGAKSRAEMLARDRKAWPGGFMCGFILWIGEQWAAWKAEAKWRGPILTQADHDSFDAWLGSAQGN